VFDWSINLLNMDFPINGSKSLPKKRSPVKKQASVVWSEATSDGTSSHLLLERLQQQELRLTERVRCLEHDQQLLREALDHLLQEDSTDLTLSEDEQN